MLLIDRYIIGRFLANFFILLMLLFTFAVAIDLLLELDEYLDVARASVDPEAGMIARTWPCPRTSSSSTNCWP